MKNNINSIFLLFVVLLFLSCEKNEGSAELPVPTGTIEVRGQLIDVRMISVGENVFPQHEGFVIDQTMADLFESSTSYAVSLLKSRGVEAFRCGNPGQIILAIDVPKLNVEGWQSEAQSFQLGEITYYLYSYHYTQVNQWVEVPNPAERKHSTLLFGNNIQVGNLPVYGTVIAQTPELRQGMIDNVCMTILPNGTYLASCTGCSQVPDKGVSLFLSDDKGKSWRILSHDNLDVNGIAGGHNLFVHKGVLYMLGVGVNGQNILISRSEDNGRTWSYPQDALSGVLKQGVFTSSSMPVVVGNGRIWRSMESIDNGEKSVFVISAPEDSNLLEAKNWTATNSVQGTIPDGSDWLFNDRFPITEISEGNMVVTPDGKLYNILSAHSNETSLAAARAKVVNETTMTLSSQYDMIQFPGGGKKFTIRYDEKSQRFWAITNPASTNEGTKHDGIYNNRMPYDLIRNRMVLCYSTDLSLWIQYKEVVSDNDPFFHGFQYADWMIDGDDIVIVARVAAPEKRGLPQTQSTTNFMSFFRLRNFRTL